MKKTILIDYSDYDSKLEDKFIELLKDMNILRPDGQTSKEGVLIIEFIED